MDEFTSALDSHTEDNIINNFYKHLPNSTMIMIAHRKETIKSVMKFGKSKMVD